MAASPTEVFEFEREAKTFDEYTQKVLEISYKAIFYKLETNEFRFLVGRCFNYVKKYET